MAVRPSAAGLVLSRVSKGSDVHQKKTLLRWHWLTHSLVNPADEPGLNKSRAWNLGVCWQGFHSRQPVTAADEQAPSPEALTPGLPTLISTVLTQLTSHTAFVKHALRFQHQQNDKGFTSHGDGVLLCQASQMNSQKTTLATTPWDYRSQEPMTAPAGCEGTTHTCCVKAARQLPGQRRERKTSFFQNSHLLWNMPGFHSEIQKPLI